MRGWVAWGGGGCLGSGLWVLNGCMRGCRLRGGNLGAWLVDNLRWLDNRWLVGSLVILLVGKWLVVDQPLAVGPLPPAKIHPPASSLKTHPPYPAPSCTLTNAPPALLAFLEFLNQPLDQPPLPFPQPT